MDKFPFNLADLTGVKSTGTLICAFLGSAISMSYMPKLTPAQTFLAVMAGTTTAVVLAPLALHSMDWPDSLERGVSFLLGLLAMPLLPAAVDRIKGLIGTMSIKFPWSKE